MNSTNFNLGFPLGFSLGVWVTIALGSERSTVTPKTPTCQMAHLPIYTASECRLIPGDRVTIDVDFFLQGRAEASCKSMDSLEAHRLEDIFMLAIMNVGIFTFSDAQASYWLNHAPVPKFIRVDKSRVNLLGEAIDNYLFTDHG